MPQGETTTNATETTTTAKAQGQGQKAKPKKASAKKQGQQKPPKAKKEPKPKKEKPVRTTPAHMSKVDKVAAQLPALTHDASVVFTAANNMSTADMNSLVAHLNISIRRRGVMALQQGGGASKLEVGQRVRVKSGSGGAARFVGQMGTVAKLQRIRCYVRLDGRNKDDYFFIADVEPVGGAKSQGSAEETLRRLTSQPQPVDISTIEDEDLEAGEASATG